MIRMWFMQLQMVILIVLLTVVSLSPESDEATIRQIPMGGVSIPMARFVTTITPK